MKNNQLYRLLFAGIIMVCGGVSLAKDISPDDFTGQKYLLLRDAFIKQGWLPDTEHSETTVYPEFPEISCGAGIDAICSAGFKLDSRYEAVMVEVKNGELIVAGSY